MPRYIYHYHVTCQLPASGEISHVDGVADMKKEIADMDAYKRLKSMIAKDNDLPIDNVIIENLSLLKES